MASKTVWDDRALREVVTEAAECAVEAVTVNITGNANALATHVTGHYHPEHKSPGRGPTAARYEGNVENHRGIPVGIVFTGNYAAMVDNMLNNTLLKAKG